MHRSPALLLALPLVVALETTTVLGTEPQGEGPSNLRAALGREAAVQHAELGLAQGGGFYLRLDARSRKLSLMLEGVPLRDHPLEALETASPRVLFWRRPPPAGWELRGWAGGRLDPERARERAEVVAPTPSSTGDAASVEPSPPPVPPTAEEAYSVPVRYRILFAAGPTLEVMAEDGGRNREPLLRGKDALARYAADLLGVVQASGSGRVRIRVRMSAEDAASLYRSLPPDVGMVVVGLASR